MKLVHGKASHDKGGEQNQITPFERGGGGSSRRPPTGKKADFAREAVPRFVGTTEPRPAIAGELLRPDKYLEVGLTPDEREVVVNFPGDAYTPAHHTVFSADQARSLARLLNRKADECGQ